MQLILLAQSAGITPGALALLGITSLGIALNLALPPQHRSVEEAVLAASTVF